MNTSYFFGALTRTLFESCLQAALAWLLIKAFIVFNPKLTAEARYRLLYSGMMLAFTAFAATLTWHLQEFSAPVSQLSFSSGTQLALLPAHIVPLRPVAGDFFGGDYSRWICLLYFGGLLVNSSRLMLGYARIKKVNNSAGGTPALWEERLTGLCGRTGIRRKVSLCFGHLSAIPFTSGYIKPVIFFPLAALSQLSIAQVEAILLHELAHIKRNDYLFNIIQQIVRSFLFFNPFIWLLNRDINREREYCCDDQVLALSGNAGEYASALLLLEENRGNAPAFAMAAGGQQKFPLFTRIKRMIMKTPDPSPFQKIVFLAASAGICFSIAWTIPETGVKRAVNHLKAKVISVNKIASAVKEKLSLLNDTDTVKKKKTSYKLLVQDENGVSKEYGSVDQLPEKVKKELLQNLGAGGGTSRNYNDSTWQKTYEDLAKKYSSPEWQETYTKMAEQYSSAEWQKAYSNIAKQYSSPEWQKLYENLAKQYSSPEWQQAYSDIAKQYSSPEWQKAQEELLKTLNSKNEELLKWLTELSYNNHSEGPGTVVVTTKYPKEEAERVKISTYGKSNSIEGTPLIIVDGLPSRVNSSNFKFNTATNDEFAKLLGITASDITKIAVLKDAAATSIWGTAGKDGVIVISTRAGQVAGANQRVGPLVVVDGKPLKTDTSKFPFATATEEDYAKLIGVKMTDIKSITVLKDAASIRIWGQAAAGGVLIIDTKSAGVNK